MSENNEFPWHAAYPDGVRIHLEYPEQPLTAFLDASINRVPARKAIIYYGRPFTYGELGRAVNKLASALKGLGIGRGDRVAVMLPNCPQFVMAFYALLRLGAVVVPVNPLNSTREIWEQLGNAECRALICLDTQLYKVGEVCERADLDFCIFTGLYDYMPTVASYFFRRRKKSQGRLPEFRYNERFLRFKNLVARGSEIIVQADVNPRDDIAVLQYSGGTSGVTKAAMLTHYNLTANLLQIREWFFGIQEDKEVFLGTLPFTHIFGLTAVMNYALMLGATMVVLPRFSAGKVLSLIRRYGVTVFPGTPTMFAAVKALLPPGEGKLGNLKLCISGAAALPAEVAADFTLRTGADLIEGFGLTEASPVTHCNPLTGNRKPGSVGVPLPDTLCRIVDLETGSKDLPVGVAGELLVKGPQVMKGYWKMPNETSAVLRDGWLYTGDIARMDKKGRTYIVDRKKDMIINGGYNIYPEEIERVIRELPGVVDVAVVGIPDAFHGEIIKAYVVKEKDAWLGEEDVLAHCKKSLARYKVPRRVEFKRELPKTTTGKTLRRVLLEEEKNRLGFN